VRRSDGGREDSQILLENYKEAQQNPKIDRPGGTTQNPPLSFTSTLEKPGMEVSDNRTNSAFTIKRHKSFVF
jgi:hypothetical protein